MNSLYFSGFIQQPPVVSVQTPAPTLASESVSFSGFGYVQLPRSYVNWLRKGGASFDITTTDSDALILYHGARKGARSEDSEFIAVGLRDGYVELR